ncbi:MAG: TspO/MBR family protein [Halodesulfurarchaeum sp.]
MVAQNGKIAGAARNRPLLSLGLSVLLVEFVGASGAVFTASGLEGWYDTLVLPAVAPPNWVFAPVWTVLFALMGAAVWRVWRRAPAAPRAAKLALGVFAVHFFLNLGWSAVFFGRQAVGSGLAVIAALWVAIAATIAAFDRVDRQAAVLMVPYLAWVTFAAYLNYRIWLLN